MSKGWDPEPRELPDEEYEILAEEQDAKRKSKRGRKERFGDKWTMYWIARDLAQVMGRDELRSLSNKFDEMASTPPGEFENVTRFTCSWGEKKRARWRTFAKALRDQLGFKDYHAGKKNP